MREQFNEGEQVHVHGGGERRLVLDAEEERMLDRTTGDGHQRLAQPPAGTIGAPPSAAGDKTDLAHTVPGGGGPADPAPHEAPHDATPESTP